MGKPTIHPNWSVTPRLLTDGYSLEITAKDVESLRAASPRVDPDTPVAITFLPGEEFAVRVAATRAVRELWSQCHIFPPAGSPQLPSSRTIWARSSRKPRCGDASWSRAIRLSQPGPSPTART